MVTVPPLAPMSNVDILNAIRGEASPQYQTYVPEATQANLQSTVDLLYSWQPTRNEFLSALVNQVGMIYILAKYWENPLAKFKRGPLNFGDSIEEIMVGIARAHTYSNDRDYVERDIFGQEPNDVQSSFHRIDREEFYKVTIKDKMLRRAFTSDTGLFTLIAGLMGSATNADNLNEFLTMCRLFREYERKDGFYKVHVPNISAISSGREEANGFLRQARGLALELPFYNTKWSASKMPTFAAADELELFITPQGQAAIDVEGLAAAFNEDKASMYGRTTVIPEEQFNIPGAQAILTTKDFFVVSDSVYETRQASNPVGLHENFFLHHQGVISASRFVPAVLFTTGEGTPIYIYDEPITGVEALTLQNTDGTTATVMKRGFMYVVHAEATSIDPAETAVRYVIETGTAGTRLSNKTYVSKEGFIHVSLDEDSSAIKVTAYAVNDNSQVSTATYNIVGDRASLWPNDVDTDTDLDGLFEATPLAPTQAGNKVTIPDVEGVQYKKAGVDVAPGETTISASTVFTAVAKSSWEIKAGAIASWTFAP